MEDKTTIQLYQMLKDVTQLFDKFNIKYWADGGTYLGAIRHQGIIPWDDDLDLGIENNVSQEKIVKFKEELKKLNYGIVKQNFGYKIFPKDGEKIKIDPWLLHCNKIKKKYGKISRSELYKLASQTYKKPDKIIYHKYKYPFLDLFEYKSEYNKLYTKGDESWWSNTCYYNETNLNKLKKKKFGNFHIKVMPDYDRYFSNCYGSDWNIYGYVSGWDHKKEKHSRKKDKKKIKLTNKLRQPKKPFS